MSGTNPVASFLDLNNAIQDPATYKAGIDGNFEVAKRFADAFAPRQQASPNMTVLIDAGAIFSPSGSVLTEVAAQSTGTITAPAGNSRIDRVVTDSLTGNVSVVAGTENASPVAPAIPSGKTPCARVLLQTSSVVITNNMITDERAPPSAYGDLLTLSQRPLFNRFLNGDWLIDQINEGALYSNAGGVVQTVDGWTTVGVLSAGIFKVRRLTDPDFANQKCLEITCTTADASIAAGDAYYLYQSIEACDVADLRSGLATAAKITIMFDMKFSVAGTYCIGLRNSANNRFYVATVTQNVANARESKVITLTLDTTGTWLYNPGVVGLTVVFCLAAGSTFQGTGNVWGAGSDIIATSAQANFMSSTSNIGYIGPIKLVAGVWPVSIYAGQSFADQLQRCQRYYEKSFAPSTAVANNTTDYSGALAFTQIVGASTATMGPYITYKVRKCFNGATFTLYNPNAPNSQIWNAGTGTSWSLCSGGNQSDVGSQLLGTTPPGSSGNFFSFVHWTANARLS